MRCSIRCAAFCLGALALGLVVAPLSSLADIPKEAKAIELKDGKVTVEGQILDNDPKDRVRNFPSKLFAIKLKANKSYQIDLVSKDFDAYLRVDDADSKQVAQDDDSGGNLNARIKFQPEKDGTYVISATTFGGGTGDFTLQVTEAGAKAAGGKELTLKDGSVTVNDKMDEKDTKDKVGPGRAKTYTIKLEAGKTYQIDMGSADEKFDCYLRFEDATGKQLAQDDDSGGGVAEHDARITFNCQNAGVYRIIATTFAANNFGEYTLKVQQK